MSSIKWSQWAVSLVSWKVVLRKRLRSYKTFPLLITSEPSSYCHEGCLEGIYHFKKKVRWGRQEQPPLLWLSLLCSFFTLTGGTLAGLSSAVWASRLRLPRVGLKCRILGPTQSYCIRTYILTDSPSERLWRFKMLAIWINWNCTPPRGSPH